MLQGVLVRFAVGDVADKRDVPAPVVRRHFPHGDLDREFRLVRPLRHGLVMAGACHGSGTGTGAPNQGAGVGDKGFDRAARQLVRVLAEQFPGGGVRIENNPGFIEYEDAVETGADDTFHHGVLVAYLGALVPDAQRHPVGLADDPGNEAERRRQENGRGVENEILLMRRHRRDGHGGPGEDQQGETLAPVPAGVPGAQDEYEQARDGEHEQGVQSLQQTVLDQGLVDKSHHPDTRYDPPTGC